MGGRGSGRGGMPLDLFEAISADCLAERPTRTISAEHGVDPTTVRKIRRAMHRFDEILAALLGGRSLREIAVALSVDATSVRKIREGVHALQRQKSSYLRHVLPLSDYHAQLAEESETRELLPGEEALLTAAINSAANRVFKAKILDAAGSPCLPE